MAKSRSTLILFIAILVLGLFIWAQKTWRSNMPSRKTLQVRLFDLNPETLTAITFQYTNNVTVECVKENGIWMTGGAGTGRGRADLKRMGDMIIDLNRMGKGTTITARHLEMRGMDEAEYGFDAPSLEITAFDHRGEHRWLVGRRTPLGDMVYVKEPGKDEIYTVLDYLLAIAPAGPDDLRDRTLFPGTPEGVRRIEIRGTGGFLQLLRDADQIWQIQQPLAVAADSRAVEDMLSRLYRLRIEEFIAENVSDFSVYGLQVETRQISLGGADGSSRMLVIGDAPADRPGKVYARRADDTSVFLLDSKILELVDIRDDALRDARVLPIPAREISFISISRGAEQLELAADASGNWSITRPVRWSADLQAVDQLIRLWDAAVITEFNETNAPAAPPEWTVDFGSSSLARTNRLEILPTRGDRTGLCLRHPGDSGVYRINLPQVPDAMLDPLNFKDRRIWDLKRSDIQKLSIIRNEQPAQVIERQADGTFAPVPAGTAVRIDEEGVERMLTVLSSAATRSYVAYNPRDLAIYGLSEPSMVLQVGLSGTNQLGRVLLIGQEAAEGYYAMVKGQDVVFILDKPLVDMLSAEPAGEPSATVPDSE